MLNNSFSEFVRGLEVGFNLEKIEDENEKKAYLASDILEQNDDYNALYTCIKNYCGKIDSQKDLQRLYRNLRESEINLLLTIVKNKGVDYRVNYYLDINERAVKLDKVDIFKGYLFKDEYLKITSEWGNIQIKLKKLRESGVQYPIASLIEHYYACKSFECFEGKLKRFNGKDYTINTNLTINGDTFRAGTNLIECFQSVKSSDDILGELTDYIDFLIAIMSDDVNSSRYKNRFPKGTDVDTRTNTLIILKRILKN